MRVGIVINPISGRGGRRTGEAARRRDWAIARAASAGVDADVVVTERQGHAREAARVFVGEGRDTVVAVGGDGTVNEAAQALVGTETALGIVPCGSGDGFARGLGLPAGRDEAMRVALSSEVRVVDVGYAGDRLFLNIAGVGFDGAVAGRFAARSTRGVVGYVVEATRLWWTYAVPDYDLQWRTPAGEDGRHGRWFLMGVANAPTYGNRAVLAPDADPADGALDLAMVESGSRWQHLWRARRLVWRHRRPARGFERARITHAIVRADAMTGHVDGEPFEASGTLEIRIRRQALRVRAGSAA